MASFRSFVSLFVLMVSYTRAATNATCSKREPTCPNNAICDPNTYRCVPEATYEECGEYGDFLWCGANGVVWGECGSGKGADCYEANICPSKKEGYEAISCNFPELMPNNGTLIWNTTYWLCGDDGEELTCLNDQGSVFSFP